MNWALAAGSLAAVLALAGVARLLALGGSGRIDSADHAIRLAEDALAGFEARDTVVCGKGGGAVVFGTGCTVALIRPSGARFLVREVKRPRWRTTEAGLSIDGGDPMPVLLTLEPADVEAVRCRLDAAADTGVSTVRA